VHRNHLLPLNRVNTPPVGLFLGRCVAALSILFEESEANIVHLDSLCDLSIVNRPEFGGFRVRQRYVCGHDLLSFRAYVLAHQLDVGIVNLICGHVLATCSRWRRLLGSEHRGRDERSCGKTESESNVFFRVWTLLFRSIKGQVRNVALALLTGVVKN
jgi:hypothetical protein